MSTIYGTWVRVEGCSRMHGVELEACTIFSNTLPLQGIIDKLKDAEYHHCVLLGCDHAKMQGATGHGNVCTDNTNTEG